MAEEATTQGADAGELATAAAGSAGDDALLDALGTKEEDPLSDASFVEKLGKVDPGKLPNELRIKLEKSVLPDATRQRQELAEERRRIESDRARVLDLVGLALQQKGVQPTQEQRDELREKVIAGDLEAIPQLVERMVGERVTPQMNELRLKGIFDESQRAFPVLAEPEVSSLVNETIQGNPTLLAMSRAGNLEGTRFVLQGLAYQVMNQRLQKELTELKDPARAKKIADDAVAAYRAKVSGLPATTTRSGTSSHATPAEKPMTEREAMEAAFAELNLGS